MRKIDLAKAFCVCVVVSIASVSSYAQVTINPDVIFEGTTIAHTSATGLWEVP